MRYVHLWFSFLKMSWMADLEYRLNIVLRAIGEIGWYIAQLSIFEVLYTHAKTISGWDVHAMRVFMGALFVADVLYIIFFQENAETLFSLVRKGDLDLYLTKPIDSQFMVSLRKVATAYFFNFIGTLFYLAWAIHHLPQPVTVLQVITFFFLIAMGFVSLYSIRFMFSTLTVLLQDAGNIHFVWHQLYRLATRPDPVYPYFMRVIILTIFPVAFFASVPSRVFVEGYDWGLLFASPCFALGTFYLSRKFWNFALRHYSSASS
jgi:ABC-2 type transport system permease protein